MVQRPSHPVRPLAAAVASLALAALAAAAPAARAPRPEGAAELRTFELANGIPVLFVAAPDAQRVRGQLLFRAGSLYEPADRPGLVELLADVLRRGGSSGASGADLDAWLDEHEAELAIRHDLDALRFELACRADDLEGLLQRIGDLLALPTYTDATVAAGRARVEAAIAEREADPGYLAAACAARIAHGIDSPFAPWVEPDDLKAIDADDLRAFHAANLGANRALVGVTGSVARDELQRRLESALGELDTVSPAPPQEPPVVFCPFRTRIYLLDAPGASETALHVGSPGFTQDSRLAAPAELWSWMMSGSGERSRAARAFADVEGLRGDVEIGYTTGWNRMGSLRATCRAANDEVGTVLEELFGVLETARLEEPTREEVLLARSDWLTREQELAADPEHVLEHAVEAAFHGYPSDHRETLRAEVGAQTERTVHDTVQANLLVRRLMVVASSGMPSRGRRRLEVALWAWPCPWSRPRKTTAWTGGARRASGCSSIGVFTRKVGESGTESAITA